MRLLSVFAVLLGASAVQAQSVETIPFRAALAARNETTPIVDQNATGGATIWVHVVRDSAGRVVSGSVDFQISYRFSGPTTLTAMHIHRGAAGAPGPVVVPVPLTRFDDATGVGTLSNRQVQFAASDANTGVYDAVVALLADPSGYYYNVHTADAPAGAIRGQLQRAEMKVLMGQMSPANENPPIQGLAASGVATVVALRTMDASFNVTSAAMIFDINYTGFPAGTEFTGLHIHIGPAGMNGPVTLDSGISGANRVPAAGTGAGNLRYEFQADLARARAAEAIYALFDNPGQAYINLHTAVNPGGAIRAQLHKMDHAVFQVTMNPQEEVVTPPLTIDASAPAALHVYTLRNADGTAAAGSLIFDVNPRFPSGTTFTAMHVHDQVAGQNGPVSLDSRLAASPILPEGSNGNLWRIVTLTSTQQLASLNSLIQNPERHYLNLHTQANPGGAVRAQLGPATVDAPSISSAFSAVSDPARTVAANQSLMMIFGNRMAKVAGNLEGLVDTSNIPKSMNGTSVTIGGVAAPLVLVSPGQLVVQVPSEVAAGQQPLVVTSSAGASSAFQLNVQPSSPNIFFDPVGGLITKTNFTLIRPDNPAAAGDVLIIFSTGNGQTTPALETGRVPPSSPLFTAPTATVTIGGRDAEVIYSLASPGFPGLYQTAVRVPAGVAAGTAAVVMRVGGVASNSVNIAVR